MRPKPYKKTSQDMEGRREGRREGEREGGREGRKEGRMDEKERERDRLCCNGPVFPESIRARG